ncbi:hypothetical protein [Sphingomonas azotifigens]|uniref:hypothetical protein n=1 Tax=Sphingomonas azotifigens TaxID=330920 RepID=UPI0009FC035D|nr:hypothetical protein [Sphingomonas azotifigens]
MRKNRALSTSRESLQIVAYYPQQSYALRRTHEMLGEKITSVEQTHVLFDYEATAYLTDLSRRLLTLPPPARLAEEMAQLEADGVVDLGRVPSTAGREVECDTGIEGILRNWPPNNFLPSIGQPCS